MTELRVTLVFRAVRFDGYDPEGKSTFSAFNEAGEIVPVPKPDWLTTEFDPNKGPAQYLATKAITAKTLRERNQLALDRPHIDHLQLIHADEWLVTMDGSDYDRLDDLNSLFDRGYPAVLRESELKALVSASLKEGV